MRSLKHTLELLSKHHQRATYGAVAELIGRTPQTVLQGCPRNWLHSWVVNQQTGEPSGYPSGKVHPALTERAEILRTGAQLSAWLDAHEESPATAGSNQTVSPPAA